MSAENINEASGFSSPSADAYKRAFKRREMEHELGHETRQAERDNEVHHVYINKKVWKKDGKPVAFASKRHAQAAGRTILNKDPSKTVHVVHHSFTQKTGGNVKEDLDQGMVAEELTSKTIKSSDKVKVARVIADMLGVENAETLSPDQAVNLGLRQMRTKRLTPDTIQVVKKMLGLAKEVGIKIDQNALPKSLAESEEIDTTTDYNAAKGILRKSDYDKLKKMSSGDNEPGEKDPTEVGHSMHGDDDHVRRMKVKYKIHEEESGEEIGDDDLDKMVNDVDHEDDILDVYDGGELKIVDDETGDEVEDDGQEVNEEVLSEVLSRAERMRARIRFMRTASKRSRKLRIVLHRRSDTKTINKRARRLAIAMLKQKLAKKPLSKMSVAEKERAERFIQSRKALVDRLAMKLIPRIRSIESERLSHDKATAK
jgi:hypothetical protein